MRLPSQCIRFEESVIFLEGVMNSDFAHTSIIYRKHMDSLCIHKSTRILALLSIYIAQKHFHEHILLFGENGFE